MRTGRNAGVAALGILLAASAMTPVPSGATRLAEARVLTADEGTRSNSVIPTGTVEQQSVRKRWLASRYTPGRMGYLKKDGYSVRVGQRRATKARNVARNRAAHK